MFRPSEEKIISAYYDVCDQDDPYRTYAILNEIERCKILLFSKDLKNLLPEDYVNQASQYLAQTLLRSERRIVNTAIMCWVAGNVSTLTVPYPKQWRDCLSAQGVPVSQFGSIFSFFLGQIKAWVRAWRTYKAMINLAKNSYDVPENNSYSVISQVPQTAIPLKNRSYQKYTFFDWLVQNKKIDQNETVFIQSNQAHMNTNSSCHIATHVLPRLTQSETRLFHQSACALFIGAALRWICGNWHAPYLLSAALEHKYFDQVKNPARQYIYSNSEFAIRPFWTYGAELKGSQIIQYFYSSNVNCFYKGQIEDSSPPPGYIAMSWPHYWVADEDQKTFLRDNCQISETIDVVGVIDFTDSDEALPSIPPHSIALFDISPFDIKHVAGMALIAPYYTPEILMNYLRDVLECARATGVHIVWKQKRDIPAELLSDAYMNIVNELNHDPNIIHIPSGISARRVLESVDACISIPFTSTAILANEMGRASVYYDPLSCLDYTKNLSRGLPIIKGKKSLLEWMNKIPTM